MNWTSTKHAQWQMACQNFLHARIPFELRDLATQEHLAFVKRLLRENAVLVDVCGTTVIFTPCPRGSWRLSNAVEDHHWRSFDAFFRCGHGPVNFSSGQRFGPFRSGEKDERCFVAKRL